MAERRTILSQRNFVAPVQTRQGGLPAASFGDSSGIQAAGGAISGAGRGLMNLAGAKNDKNKAEIAERKADIDRKIAAGILETKRLKAESDRRDLHDATVKRDLALKKVVQATKEAYASASPGLAADEHVAAFDRFLAANKASIFDPSMEALKEKYPEQYEEISDPALIESMWLSYTGPEREGVIRTESNEIPRERLANAEQDVRMEVSMSTGMPAQVMDLSESLIKRNLDTGLFGREAMAKISNTSQTAAFHQLSLFEASTNQLDRDWVMQLAADNKMPIDYVRDLVRQIDGRKQVQQKGAATIAKNAIDQLENGEGAEVSPEQAQGLVEVVHENDTPKQEELKREIDAAQTVGKFVKQFTQGEAFAPLFHQGWSGFEAAKKLLAQNDPDAFIGLVKDQWEKKPDSTIVGGGFDVPSKTVSDRNYTPTERATLAAKIKKELQRNVDLIHNNRANEIAVLNPVVRAAINRGESPAEVRPKFEAFYDKQGISPEHRVSVDPRISKGLYETLKTKDTQKSIEALDHLMGYGTDIVRDTLKNAANEPDLPLPVAGLLQLWSFRLDDGNKSLASKMMPEFLEAAFNMESMEETMALKVKDNPAFLQGLMERSSMSFEGNSMGLISDYESSRKNPSNFFRPPAKGTQNLSNMMSAIEGQLGPNSAKAFHEAFRALAIFRSKKNNWDIAKGVIEAQQLISSQILVIPTSGSHNSRNQTWAVVASKFKRESFVQLPYSGSAESGEDAARHQAAALDMLIVSAPTNRGGFGAIGEAFDHAQIMAWPGHDMRVGSRYSLSTDMFEPGLVPENAKLNFAEMVLGDGRAVADSPLDFMEESWGPKVAVDEALAHLEGQTGMDLFSRNNLAIAANHEWKRDEANKQYLLTVKSGSVSGVRNIGDTEQVYRIGKNGEYIPIARKDTEMQANIDFVRQGGAIANHRELIGPIWWAMRAIVGQYYNPDQKSDAETWPGYEKPKEPSPPSARYFE
jgi:hypothetical protein